MIDIGLLVLMAAAALAVLRQRDLLASVILAGAVSLLAAALYVVLDAVDVAFTEAAVGAGMSTVLMLGALALVGREEKRPSRRPWLGLLAVTATGALLVYGLRDLPPYGDPSAPIHHHVVPRYMNDSQQEVGPPNVVTSVLAAYRGYDTMGETTVIFTAAFGVLALIGRGPLRRRRPPRREEEEG